MAAVEHIHANDPLSILGAKAFYQDLPHELKKKLDSFEKKMIRSFRGKKPLEEHFEESMESLFNLRLQLWVWLQSDVAHLKDIVSSVQPQLDDLCTDPKVGKIGFIISRAMDQNQVLLESVAEPNSDTLYFNKDKTKVPKVKLFDLLDTLVIMGPREETFAQLIVYSLYFEMLAISAVLIHQEIIIPVPSKLKDLLNSAEEIVNGFCKYVGKFNDDLRSDLLQDEQRSYRQLGTQYFNLAFSNDEPDYNDSVIVVSNPDYKE